MRLPVLVLTCLVSALPLLAGWWTRGATTPGAGLQAGVVLLPWVFVAGLPRRADAPSAGPLLLLALLAPPLALAAAHDVARAEAAAVLACVGCGAVLVVVLAHAAERAGRVGGAVAVRHAVAWLLLVPFPAAVAVVHGLSAQPPPPPAPAGAAGWVDGLGPLALVHALTRGEQPGAAAWALALAVVALVVALAHGPADDASGSEAGA